MKKLLILLSVALSISTLSYAASEATSFRPGAEWVDNNGVAINAHGGGVMFHEGRYYWYGEHKIAGQAGNLAMVGIHCYSSQDLYNWRDEGVVLHVSEDPESEITKRSIIERPKVIYNPKTKKFVMWFHLELRKMGYLAARSGVAICDSPTGEFKYLKSVNPNAGEWPLNIEKEMKYIPKEGTVKERLSGKGDVRIELVEQNIVGRDHKAGQMARDMTLFVDDDGKAYHIYSSEENSTTHIAELSDDFQSHSGRYARAFPRRWMEAPAMMKSDGHYYFLASGCSGWDPNAARSAVAKDIMGPWLECDNPCVGLNPHEGMDERLTFGGQSTFFLRVEGREDAYIAMFDVWKPKNPIDGRYVWLPVKINHKAKTYKIEWLDEWDLSIFDKE